MKSPHTKASFEILFVIMVVIVIAILFSPYCAEYYLRSVDYFSQKPFNSSEWKIKYNSENPVRQKMRNDLLARYDFKGMTKEQILELLGKPDREIPSERMWCYYLGTTKHFIPMDKQELRLVFQGNIAEKQYIFR
ncbi:MAG: hypothetical protein A2452_06005 [Candidatus Firestonebacteria bacterium RIFOXYC2_FULL_39_67]|nr:MAG: hypothetical protein A2536_12460 [Candidatus Firestonebacteria bacterium RIFOXYD2_FULL_39_29]OGF56640.1 MAG: hypothetical protein A2452_06005 [Candidatus Firestonebacteria bacterium RIFOXYC2_FULL_39_67]OGF57116.1 MAG: hypothetical protein A2497_04550 [Candidatus Firestonebacteria bacterium RifOxyC12_full_39_7]